MHSLTIEDIIDELNLGRATVKFILNRFSAILPHDRIDGRACYNQATLSTLIQIKDLMDQGLVPSQIETALADAPPHPAPRENQIEDVRMSQDALAFIQNLFQDIKVHQNRIARAHEKRAEAEERKAVAIEKRAEAEEKKAQAMNNIATALQEMGRQRPGDPQAMEIAGHAAQALTMNETQGAGDPESATDDTIDLDACLDDADLNDLFSPPEPGTPLTGEAEFDSLELDGLESDDLGLEDLALEIAEPEAGPPEPDDLNLLVDKISTPGEDGLLDNLLEDPGPLPDLDDLEGLIDADREVEDLDDLSSLLDMQDTGQAELDDLSALVDTADGEDLDDLSRLVEAPDSGPAKPETLDDLCLLVDMPTGAGQADMDDLSALVDESPADAAGDLDDLWALVANDPRPEDMDDLSALVSSEAPADTAQTAAAQTAAAEQAPAEPSLKPDITPEEDMAKYKATVMKIIIDLKNRGLSAGETTERLNRDEVPTLSGKPLWREKAISKIYGFIESAK